MERLVWIGVCTILFAGCLGPSHNTEPTPTPAADAVRFLVVGDTGTGSPTQYQVARAMEEVCMELGCDFALLLGDAIYESGVSGDDDPQFATKFELPYANLYFPFYVVLGNHDYGSGAGSDLHQGRHNVDYSEHSSRWTMPDLYYGVEAGAVDLFGLDSGPATARATFQDTYIREQGDWLRAELADSDAPWKVVFAHHPYISNGVHGNAGQYDGVEGEGAGWQTMIEREVCGHADYYLAGHDHDLQLLPGPAGCDTAFIVSGAGAKQRGPGPGGNEATFEAYNTNGFAWMAANETTMDIRFYGADAALLYQTTDHQSIIG